MYLKNFKIHHGLITIICIALALLTLAVYWQTREFSFVTLDDQIYVAENRHVQNGLTRETLRWCFTGATPVSNYWVPLTWLSHLVDFEIFGLNPGGYHITNFLLHIASTIVLFLALQHMTKDIWQSAFVAALFAIHPLHVESVAWISERKDALSAFFWMLTLWYYAKYTDHPGFIRYLPVMLFACFGLMSKPMVVTLPFVLLLLDIWPLKRFRLGINNAPRNGNDTSVSLLRLVIEKIPIFFMIGLVSIAAYITQGQGGAIVSLQRIPVYVRLQNAIVAYVVYIKKMLWPFDLAAIYPHPGALPLWQVIGSFVIVGSVSTFSILRIKKQPYLAVGWFWYLGTLIPVIGIVAIGSHVIADRYTYIPLIGIFMIIAWGLPEIFPHWRLKKHALAVIGVVAVAGLTALGYLQTGYWRDGISLFEHNLKITPNNYLAHTNLGIALIEDGKVNEGILHYKKALQIRPDHSQAHYNLGFVLDRRGKLEDAIAHYRQAIASRPGYLKAHNNLGVALARQGKIDEAAVHFEAALRIEPDLAETHFNLGRCYLMKKKTNEANEHFKEVVRLRPDYAPGYYMLGMTLARSGKLQQGIVYLQKAVELNPRHKGFNDTLQRALEAANSKGN